MKKSLTLIVLLATMLSLTACGGAAQQGEQAAPSEPQQTQAQSVSEEAAQEEPAPEEPAPEESAPEDNGAAQSGGEERAAGPSVTTIQGEEVSLGGGDATALFFMAGW